MYRLNCLNYKYNDKYYFQVAYNKSIIINDCCFIEILKKQKYFSQKFLFDLFHKYNYSEDNIRFLKDKNIIIKIDNYREILINILEKLIYHIENGEKEDDINTIFVYSDNYGYRSINVVKAAIELERNFIIERCFQNDMRIKFDNGYIYDINNKYSIFKENIVGCNVTKSKSLTSYLLNSHGIKVPKQKLFYTEDLSQLNNFIEEIKYPICLKPDNRCESIDVFCCVKNEKELDKIINFYKSLYKKFVVEKSIPGNVYRLYYCYGEIIGVIRKNKSFVIGDGMNTIQNLVNKKYNFTEFEKCYKEYSLILERLKLSRNNILPLGKRLYISDTAPGDEFEDFNIKRLDTYYEKLVLSVSKAIGLNIFAIDLIAESLNKVKKCMPTVLEIQEGPEFGRKNSNIDKYYKKIIEQLSS